ncbi:putative sensor domain DACNV-containing protein [Stieleria varia]|uniref:DAC domain-containing protein n=1 Tax=Stieleria varia TaxID=2528005 RepID=A0A5C6AT87_9BACT|nr:diadenylate cyclase [Stieleria varia]TWU02930.1 hypothetical protein Pla52n_40180 [Stieleria varia]
MIERSLYPVDLSNVLRKRWGEEAFDAAELPNDSILESLIDTAYQASLLREESDPVQCRIMVASPDDVELAAVAKADGLYSIEFEDQSALSAHEIRKMAAAAGYYRSLIAVNVDASENTINIWGMVVTGANWVNHTEFTVHDAAALPGKLVIHVLGAGHLIFAKGLRRVVETVGGQRLPEGFDPFRSNCLPNRFKTFRDRQLSKLNLVSHSDGMCKPCDSFARDVSQSVIRRVLSLVRGRGHGGMIIYVSDALDPRLDKWLRMRIRFKPGDSTMRFEQLLLKVVQRAVEVGAMNGLSKVRWQDFLQMHDASLAKLHNSLVEYSHFLADLMSVDGALVIDHELRLIGFGGEILGDSHVSSIERAIDLEAEKSVTESADSSGTRHRSAYRLVSSVQDAIAMVVSQDGGVRFVAHEGGRLVYWPYLP